VTTTERYQKASKAAEQAPGEGLTDLVKHYTEIGKKPVECADIKDVRDVFRVHNLSSQSSVPEDQERLGELLSLIDKGYVKVSEVLMPTVDEVTVAAHTPIFNGHGGTEHIRLCTIAAQWIMSTTGEQFRSEESYIAGRFDVATMDYSLYIECGNTSVMKVIDVIEAGQRLAVIPFQNEPVKAFIFEPGPTPRSDKDPFAERLRARMKATQHVFQNTFNKKTGK
jgi:hypothetical protein